MISEAAEAAQVRQRKIDAGPKREDFEREFGKDKVKDEGDGKWSLSLRDRDDIKKAHQMQEGSRRIEVERGAEMQARMKREKVVRRDGRVLEFPEDLVDTAKKNGLRPAGRNGGAPSLKYTFFRSSLPAGWTMECQECLNESGFWRQWSKPKVPSGWKCPECFSTNGMMVCCENGEVD